MAFSKNDLFDQKLNSIAVLFKALAHPARLAILRYLADTHVCITGDISDELPLSRSTVNQHLTELKNAGLIQGTVDGVKVNYCLNPEKIKDLVKVANCFFKEIDFDSDYKCKENIMKVLILCTGNSCRSQMAEGILRSFDPSLEIHSAGTRPEKTVNPNAVKVMKEIDLDISGHYPKLVDRFTGEAFDFVITVCGNAKENCPVFTGKVGKRLHIGFEDPADAKGTESEKLLVYREIRDQIKDRFSRFYKEEII